MQIDRDFKAPRSSRHSTGFSTISNGPLGTVVHGVLNSRIYCDAK